MISNYWLINCAQKFTKNHSRNGCQPNETDKTTDFASVSEPYDIDKGACCLWPVLAIGLVASSGSYTMTVNHLSGLSVIYNHTHISAKNQDTQILEVIQACSQVRSLLVTKGRACQNPLSLARTIVQQNNRSHRTITNPLITSLFPLFQLARSLALSLPLLPAAQSLLSWTVYISALYHSLLTRSPLLLYLHANYTTVINSISNRVESQVSSSIVTRVNRDWDTVQDACTKSRFCSLST